MANKVTSMQTLRTIIHMLERQYSSRTIARELQLSRNTVKHYVDQINDCTCTLKDLQALNDGELSSILYTPNATKEGTSERRMAFRILVPYFISELNRTGVTRQLLWEEYIVKDPDDNRYSQFCFHLNELSKIVAPAFHNIYNLGEQEMIDCAGDMFHYVEKATGEQFFVLSS